jgi:hypothetical protein
MISSASMGVAVSAAERGGCKDEAVTPRANQWREMLHWSVSRGGAAVLG